MRYINTITITQNLLRKRRFWYKLRFPSFVRFAPTMYQKRRFGSRDLSETDGICIFHQKRRFGSRFGATVISKPVLTESDTKHVLAVDLE